MLRLTKIALILAVSAWGMVSAGLNLLTWEGTLSAVASATSMTTIESGADSWQATSNVIVVWLGALFIVSAKIATAGFCLTGGYRMWQARAADGASFNTAKQAALVGCGIAVFMLFSGFVVTAETFFEAWRSEVLRTIALESAFRYGGMIALIAIFVAQTEH